MISSSRMVAILIGSIMPTMMKKYTPLDVRVRQCANA